MNIKLINTNKENIEENIEIVLIKNLKKVDKKDKKVLKSIDFTKTSKKTFLHLASKKLYVHCTAFKGEELKVLLSNTIRELKQYKFKSLKIAIVQENKELAIKDICEGLILGNYVYERYKAKKTKFKTNIFIDIKASKKELKSLELEFKNTRIITSSVNMVRDIVNTTAEDYTPETMSEDAKKIAKENDLTCKIYGEDYLQKNNMHTMLAVGRASRHESKLIHLHYKPKTKALGKVILVGKGLTYDSGGLSLKPTSGMINMKLDKGGGSAVLGVMNSLRELNYPYEVHGIIGAVENMIGGDAFKPGDVLYAKNKVSIEVRNTDAEGRLVLADCLCYAQDEIKDIDYIFDVATLTGACITALGTYSTGIMGHSDKLKNKMKKASFNSGELVAELPFNSYLKPIINSKIADISNSTGRAGGASILAALFLDRFIKQENKNKWLHLDIAGPSYAESPWGYNSYGATGAGVRLILEFINNLKK